MKIKVVRYSVQPTYTLGAMFLDDKYFAYTLEDTVRDVKIPKETAIPYGTYSLIVNMSTRLNKLTPRLVSVPNFDGVLIHGGNTPLDSDGCILVAANNLCTPDNGLIQGSLAQALTDVLIKAKGPHSIQILKVS